MYNFFRSLVLSSLILLAISNTGFAQQKDYYEVIGVPRSATQEEIKEKYRKEVKICHPDKTSARTDLSEAEKAELTDRYKELVNAYEVLGNPQKREIYDVTGKYVVKENTNSTMSTWEEDAKNIFGEFYTEENVKTENTVKPENVDPIELDLRLAEVELRTYQDPYGNDRMMKRGEFPAYDAKLDAYLAELKPYLIEYKKTYEQIPNVITDDMMLTVEETLKNNGFKTIQELNETFMRLETEFREELLSFQKVYSRKHWQKNKINFEGLVQPMPKMETVDEIKSFLDKTAKSWDKFLTTLDYEIENIDRATSSFKEDAKVSVSSGKVIVDEKGNMKFEGELIPEISSKRIGIKKLFLLDQIARLSVLELEKAKKQAIKADFTAKRKAVDVINELFTKETTPQRRTEILQKIAAAKDAAVQAEEAPTTGTEKNKKTKKSPNSITELAEIFYKKGKLDKKEIKNLNLYVEDYVRYTEATTPGLSRTKYKTSAWAKTKYYSTHFGKSFFSFYIAMFSTRIVEVFSGGSMATSVYERTEAQKIQGDFSDGNYLSVSEKMFQELMNIDFYISFGAFSATSVGIEMLAGQTKIMKNIMRRPYQKMYKPFSRAAINRTLFKGIAMPAVTMAVGMYAAQIVPQYRMFFQDLYSDNKDIRDAAWDMFMHNNFSPQAFGRIGAIMTSFMAAEFILSEKTIDAAHLIKEAIKHKMRKGSCRDLYSTIKNWRLNQVSPTPNTSFWKNTTRMILVFNLAEIIEHSTWYQMFPGLYDMKKSMELGYNLAVIEGEHLIQQLMSIASDPTDEELEGIYEVYDGMGGIKDVVEVFSNSPRTIKKALSYIKKDNGPTLVKNLLNELIAYIYQHQKIKTLDGELPIESIFVNLDGNIDDQKKMTEKMNEYYNSEEFAKQMYDQALSISNQIRETVKGEGAVALSEKVTVEMIAESMTSMYIIENLEQELTLHLETGDVDKAFKTMQDLNYNTGIGFMNHINYIFNSFKTMATPTFRLVGENPIYLENDSNRMTTNQIIVDDKSLCSGINTSECSKNVLHLGYTMTVLYPMMFDPKFVDEKGNPSNDFQWRLEIMMSLSKSIHTKMKESCPPEDYYKGMLAIYELIDLFLMNIPETTWQANEYDKDVLAGHAMISTLEYLGLPLGIEIFEERYNPKNKR